jgi:hypothetical protein
MRKPTLYSHASLNNRKTVWEMCSVILSLCRHNRVLSRQDGHNVISWYNLMGPPASYTWSTAHQNFVWHTTVLVSYCHYHKLPQLQGLKQHKFILLQFWRADVWNDLLANVRVWVGLCSFLGTLEENQFPCCFQLLKFTYIPWLVTPSSHHFTPCFRYHISCFCLWPLFYS